MALTSASFGLSLCTAGDGVHTSSPGSASVMSGQTGKESAWAAATLGLYYSCSRRPLVLLGDALLPFRCGLSAITSDQGPIWRFGSAQAPQPSEAAFQGRGAGGGKERGDCQSLFLGSRAPQGTPRRSVCQSLTELVTRGAFPYPRTTASAFPTSGCGAQGTRVFNIICTGVFQSVGLGPAM